MDVTGQNLTINVKTQATSNNTSTTLNITGLTNGTNYTLYFAGSNSNYQRLYTEKIYAVAFTTNSSGSNDGSGNTTGTNGERLIVGGIFMVIIMVLALISR